MAESKSCKRCGAAFKGYAGRGLCPLCMLSDGIDNQCIHNETLAGEFPSYFGNYELLNVVARGGMGIVYKARQKGLNRIVAVKMLLSGRFSDPKYVERFRAEAAAVAQLQHANIVAIHEIGEENGQLYFSMDYVEGRNLAQIISDPQRKFSNYREIALWLKSIAAAIHYAHGKGIVHRDLKPSNILIDTSNQPKITDFGLAKKMGEESDLTVVGQVIGSPNYLPPEQAAGKPAGIGSDIYSLGAILYHALTGRPPFQAESLNMLLKQVLETDPVPPRLLNPGISRDLETICLKCLEKDASHRYSTAQELSDELSRFLDDKPILAQPIGSLGKLWRWSRRQPMRAALTGALVLSVFLGTMGIFWQWKRAEQEKSRYMRLAYASDMNIAQRLLKEHSPSSALQKLDAYRPSPGAYHKPDLRGWEWRYLWGLCQNDEHVLLMHQTNQISDFAFVENDQQLAILKGGQSVEFWDWSKRSKTGTLPCVGAPWMMAVSRSKNMIVIDEEDANKHDTIVLYDLLTRKPIKTIPQQKKLIHKISISPDGNLLAGMDFETNAILLHLPLGTCVSNFTLPRTSINFFLRTPAFSPDGQILALGLDGATGSNGSLDGIIYLYDNRGQFQAVLLPSPGEGIGVSSLAFSPDGGTLAAGYGFSDATIRLWDVKKHSMKGTLIGHHAMVQCLLFSSDGRTLYSGSNDHTIIIWDLDNRRLIAQLQGYANNVTSLALSPDGKNLIGGSDDGSVRLWDLTRKRSPFSHRTLPIRAGAFMAPFTADSRCIVTASRTNSVILWDIATGMETENIPALGTNNEVVALSPDNNWIVAGNSDGCIKVWDRIAHRVIANFQAHEVPVLGMAFFDKGKTLVSLGGKPPYPYKTDAQRFDTATWQKKPFASNMVDDATSGVIQSPNGAYIAVANFFDSVKLYNSANGRLAATLSPNFKKTMLPVFSQNGKLLASATGVNGCIWEIPSGRELAVLKPANSIVSMAFAPDGKRLATGQFAGALLKPAAEIWDYTIQRELIELWSDGNYTTCVQFSPDGNTLLSISMQGIIDLWHAPSWAEIEAAEKEKP